MTCVCVTVVRVLCGEDAAIERALDFGGRPERAGEQALQQEQDRNDG